MPLTVVAILHRFGFLLVTCCSSSSLILGPSYPWQHSPLPPDCPLTAPWLPPDWPLGALVSHMQKTCILDFHLSGWKSEKNLEKMHVFCVFVWFYLHFERKHAKNMHFFEVFPSFCGSNLEFKNACFLRVFCMWEFPPLQSYWGSRIPNPKSCSCTDVSRLPFLSDNVRCIQ